MEGLFIHHSVFGYGLGVAWFGFEVWPDAYLGANYLILSALSFSCKVCVCVCHPIGRMRVQSRSNFVTSWIAGPPGYLCPWIMRWQSSEWCHAIFSSGILSDSGLSSYISLLAGFFITGATGKPRCKVYKALAL